MPHHHHLSRSASLPSPWTIPLAYLFHLPTLYSLSTMVPDHLVPGLLVEPCPPQPQGLETSAAVGMMVPDYQHQWSRVASGWLCPTPRLILSLSSPDSLLLVYKVMNIHILEYPSRLTVMTWFPEGRFSYCNLERADYSHLVHRSQWYCLACYNAQGKCWQQRTAQLPMLILTRLRKCAL